MTVAAAEQRAAKRAAAVPAAGLPFGRRTPKGRERWYLLRVPEGREAAMCAELKRLVPGDLLKDVKYYTFGDNRTEQAARAYWAKIKGEDKL